MYYVFLVIFGVLGALLRYSIGLMIHTEFPLATLLINITGCFLLAFLTQFLNGIPKLSKKMVSAIGTGFVGSFTTFSTFAVESAELWKVSDYVGAASYILASLIGGLIACVFGFQVSEKMLAKGKEMNNAD
ncbi:fluoride efflux transporter CrcB [Lentibacillus sp. N15]|uniref:fluoride efflux transporter CrcB n=1 Tax=Lentibacillus songyuanensis TaxID=3136161 RepID=UPI0031B9DADF